MNSPYPAVGHALCPLTSEKCALDCYVACEGAIESESLRPEFEQPQLVILFELEPF